jgi:hypothetical protein
MGEPLAPVSVRGRGYTIDVGIARKLVQDFQITMFDRQFPSNDNSKILGRSKSVGVNFA